MEELLKVLKDVNPNIDYENTKNLMSGKVIDSIDMTTILAQLEDTFDIEIDGDLFKAKLSFPIIDVPRKISLEL